MVQSEHGPPQKWAGSVYGTEYYPDLSQPEFSPATMPMAYGQFQSPGIGKSVEVVRTAQSSPRTSTSLCVTLSAEGKEARLYVGDDGNVQVRTHSELRHMAKELFNKGFKRKFQNFVNEAKALQTQKSQARRRSAKETRRVQEPSRQASVIQRTYDSSYDAEISSHRKRRMLQHHQGYELQLGGPEAYGSDMEEEYDDMAEQYMHDDSDEDVQPIKSISIRVGDEKACVDFYHQMFDRIQQVPCKAIAKDWIKAIAPKKQTMYPYNGGKAAKDAKEKWTGSAGPGTWDHELDGDYSRPPWWPAAIKHKEPDHIKKKDRIALLIHLLRHLYHKEPYVRVETLKQSTERTTASFADVKVTPGADHMDKADQLGKYLKDIYRLRAREEQLLDGAIDADTTESFEVHTPEQPRKSGKKKRLSSQLNSRRRTSSPCTSYCSDDEELMHEAESSTTLTSPVGKSQMEDIMLTDQSDTLARNPVPVDQSYFRQTQQGFVPFTDMMTSDLSGLPNREQLNIGKAAAQSDWQGNYTVDYMTADGRMAKNQMKSDSGISFSQPNRLNSMHSRDTQRQATLPEVPTTLDSTTTRSTLYGHRQELGGLPGPYEHYQWPTSNTGFNQPSQSHLDLPSYYDNMPPADLATQQTMMRSVLDMQRDNTHYHPSYGGQSISRGNIVPRIGTDRHDILATQHPF